MVTQTTAAKSQAKADRHPRDPGSDIAVTPSMRSKQGKSRRDLIALSGAQTAAARPRNAMHSRRPHRSPEPRTAPYHTVLGKRRCASTAKWVGGHPQRV